MILLELLFCQTIGGIRNGYETVGNIKVFSMDSFQQLEVANKVDTSQTKLHVYCKVNMASGKHEDASFVSLDDLENISILLNEDNDLEEETSHLFTELSIFIFKLEERHNQTGSIYPKHRYRNRVTCF